MRKVLAAKGRFEASWRRVVAIASTLAACSRAPAQNAGAEAGSAFTSAPATAASSAPPSPSPPFNVLLLTIDSLRADMPWAGYPRPIAPRLQALHDVAIDYPRAYSVSSFTSKSLGGLLSGHYPSELARTGLFFTHYFASNTMLCESLADAGIPCLAGHAHEYLAKGNAGLEQGFREWRVVPGITFDYNKDPYVTSDKLTKVAIEMLGDPRLAAQPFFAWFHYMDPHDEYQTHEGPHWGTRPRDRYDEEVLFTDGWIGQLLDFVSTQPWAGRTVIAVSADHGEAFGEHHEMRHGHELYEELVHVPMFFVVPGRGRRTIDVPRSQIDFAPTLREIFGLPQDPSLAGRSFAPELLGAEHAPARDVVCDLPQDDWDERRRSLLHDGWKLIAFGDDKRFELYDLAGDPGEQTDLFWKRRDVAVPMVTRYKDACRAIHDVPPTGGIPSHDAGP
jgi:choline-sulfatase